VNADHEVETTKSYELFILALTMLSLVVMVGLLLPLSDSTIGLLQFYDNVMCLIFLADFGMRLHRTRPRSNYVIAQRGWLDLVGSFPSLGVFFPFTGLFRLARLARVAKISHRLSGGQRGAIARDILANRSRYAAFITVLGTIVVLGAASVIILQFEGRSPDSLINSGGEALWYSIVTITTVGYGDFVPVTMPGRIAAIGLMIAGLGIIGALASLLASFLIGSGSDEAAAQHAAAATPDLEAEIAALKDDLAAIRSLLEANRPGEAPPREA
jgi:voltage-gated potassium channel